MSNAALILAAGRGSRAGAGAPKQYRPIDGRSALLRCLETFGGHRGVDHLLVAIHPEDREYYEADIGRLAPETRDRLVEPIAGGSERQDTVRLGLEALAATAPPEKVLIHDAARPFTSPALIDRVLGALDEVDGACAATPVVDTLRRGAPTLACGEIVPRDGLWRAQTPQGFRFRPILEAHRRLAGERATDDAEIARRAGVETRLVFGDAANVKITEAADFDFAERWAAADKAARLPDVRMGQGVDVHAFGPNADGSTDHVMLCGVRVPHETGLEAHSDGDVGLHALTDALLGAAALGDIGGHFPPSDPVWRAAASDRFLAEAARLVADAGGRPTHLDVTLVCERPKIGPHVEAMRARIAAIVGLDVARVSVKATTTEKLGFTGRGEGIAATALATVVFGFIDESGGKKG